MAETTMLTDDQLRLVDRLLDLAIDEDIGEGDATTHALFSEPGMVSGRFVARENGVMAGGGIIARFYTRLGTRFAENPNAVAVAVLRKDGGAFSAGDSLLEVRGEADIVLMGERVALNLLQRICAVAGRTRQYVDKVRGTRAKIYDTRKTTPGHRVLDKLAVRAGGGENHRMGLFDMILVKDNHLTAYGNPGEAVRRARERSSLPIMVEVDNLRQLAEVLPAEPDFVLLDNMNPKTLEEAVRLTDAETGGNGWKRPLLEASGGITLKTVAEVAATGVERISVGALTHGAGSVDIGLDFA